MDQNQFTKLKTPFRLVVVDDERAVTDTVQLFFEDEANLDYRITRDPAEGLQLITELQPHAVLTDLKMPDISGIDVLKHTKSVSAETEVILMTAHASAETAIAAMKEGAYDYLIKPFNMVELYALLGRIAHTRYLEQQNRQLKSKLTRYRSLDRLAGNSPVIQRLRSEIRMVSDNDASVLITGETGTGKSLAASLIHELSRRRDNSFITIECASIPKELLESELFGYCKGAFTGASQDKKGRMETADKGTLFLDEIGDMPVDLQAKILRAIQERVITRVGGTEQIPIDVRIIAATNRNLPSLIQGGHFREDLYYRLNVVPIRMPSLRERLDDLPELLADLLQTICARLKCRIKRISPRILEKAQQYNWPGNIRELENLLTRAAVMSKGDSLQDSCVAGLLNKSEPGLATAPTVALKTLREVENDHIHAVLDYCQGNISQAARILGISRPTLRSKLKE